MYSGSSTVVNNTCNNNNYGVYLYSSGSSTVGNNTCNNNLYGIYPHDTDSCVVTYNLLQENGAYGVYLGFGSDNNLIHHNTFVENYLLGTSQACDRGTNNYWYDTETLEGNYWSDWSGTGSYTVAGSAGSEDLYPLDEPTLYLGPPVITDIIHSPSTPTELDIITINATVTDASGVQSVTLHYRVNGGSWLTISMTFLTDNIYSAITGPFAVSDTIEYYISAVDDSINFNEAIEDNNGQYYDIFVGSSDFTSPTIENIAHSPSSPTEIDTITVNATITDTSGIYNVTLHYRVNGGIWQNISMTLVNDDIYSAILDPFSISDTIEYYFTAIDNYILKNEATEDNSGQYYDIFVGSSDTSGPSIIGVVHSPSSPTELETVTVNATVTDDSGLQSITLHYRVNGGAWQTIDMTLIGGDLYSVTIGPFAVSDTIEYYISAVDNSINYNLAINDNSGLYYSFTVSIVIPEFQMISLLLPAITCLFLGFGLVALQRRKK